jgi:hypothetical protein
MAGRSCWFITSGEQIYSFSYCSTILYFQRRIPRSGFSIAEILRIEISDPQRIEFEEAKV